MKRLKFLLISCFLGLVSTTTFLLDAQEPRDWTGTSGRVLLKSGVLDVDRTFKDVQEGTPTKVYVRVDSGLKSMNFVGISDSDRDYVLQQLELPIDVEDNSDGKNVAAVPSNPNKQEGKIGAEGRSEQGGTSSEGSKNVANEKYAFLVAASHYDTGISSLRYTINDVEDIKKRLVEIGFKTENIVVLRSGVDFGDVPTKEHIENRYKLLLSRVEKGDLVFVYLSGHGLQLVGSDVSYFAPVDVKLDDVANTSVSINETMRLLAESPAEFRWMIVDACRNDPNQKSVFTVKAPGVKEMTSLNKTPHSISLLQSCQPGAVSYEGGGNKDPNVHNGIFTLALLEAIGIEGKGDLNEDGDVSFLEICQYVTKNTNAKANYYHNAEQVPNLSGNITDFVFLEGLKKSVSKAGERMTLTYKGVEFSLRYCPPGIFTMGSPESEYGRDATETQHEAKIDEGFWICETETTQELWDAVGIKQAQKRSFKGAKLPIDNVDWKESYEFVKKLNELGIAPKGWRFELPTEEQWEYACRAGSTGATYGVNLDDCAWYYGNSKGKTHEVGMKEPNKWGVYDMLGNVIEWTGPSSLVNRGGCWLNFPYSCRPAKRFSVTAIILGNVGFRCVLVPVPSN